MLNHVEEIARSCGMSPTWEMVDHYKVRVAELEALLHEAKEVLEGKPPKPSWWLFSWLPRVCAALPTK